MGAVKETRGKAWLPPGRDRLRPGPAEWPRRWKETYVKDTESDLGLHGKGRAGVSEGGVGVRWGRGGVT